MKRWIVALSLMGLVALCACGGSSTTNVTLTSSGGGGTATNTPNQPVTSGGE